MILRALPLSLALLTGCCKLPGVGAKDDTGTTGAAGAPAVTVTSGPRPTVYRPDGWPSEIVAGVSKPPTHGEWENAPHVQHTQAKHLGCDLKMVREWLQCTCRPGGDWQGTAGGKFGYSEAKITQGHDSETFLFTDAHKTSSSVMSSVRPGRHVEALFTQTKDGATVGHVQLSIDRPGTQALPTVHLSPVN